MEVVFKRLEGAEVQEHYRLRYKIYVAEKRWEEDAGNNMEVDYWDSYSYYFGAFFRGSMIATIRGIDGRKTELPIFSRIYRDAKLGFNNIEASRVIRVRDIPVRLPFMHIMNGLYRISFEFAQESGFEWILALIALESFRRWQFYGFKSIGDSFFYKNGIYLPVGVRVSDFNFNRLKFG